jgi:protein tyrosine phosphatase (PTP) superfamily phosphohydrolase (DUF442 family)
MANSASTGKESMTVLHVEPNNVLRRWLLRAGYCLLLIILSVLALLRYVGVFGGNVRVVEEGQVYRSAQLTGDDLTRLLDERRIRSVINLRGALPNDASYRSEIATCAKSGVNHFDIRLSAERMPPPGELLKLLNALDTAARPLLVHCFGGADRSGLVSTLYLNVERGVPLDEALSRQLTWRYGHLSFGHAHAMDDFFALYRHTAGGRSLREWVQRTYPKLYEQRLAEQRHGTVPRSGSLLVLWSLGLIH